MEVALLQRLAMLLVLGDQLLDLAHHRTHAHFKQLLKFFAIRRRDWLRPHLCVPRLHRFADLIVERRQALFELHPENRAFPFMTVVTRHEWLAARPIDRALTVPIDVSPAVLHGMVRLRNVIESRNAANCLDGANGGLTALRTVWSLDLHTHFLT